ncbi:PAS domain S-box protein [Segetibacter koreensis]|uniref:PAS domain S-box protein n=1 Tax=Segetibacter koreensis TaxID=398037 RepID=UPI00035FEB07|nr:PAS domain S-box protein [Segetibacter koreensis]
MTEGFFKAIIKNSSDIILIVNTDGNFLFASDSLFNAVGYTTEEIRGKNIFDYLHPNYQLYAKKIMKGGFDEEHVSQLQVKFITKNNGWRWMEFSITNMLDDESVNGIVINARLINQKIKAELLKRDSQVLYQSLFENHPDAVFSLCSAGNFLSINTGALQIFGFSEEEMIDTNFCSIVEDSDIHSAKAAFIRALAGKCQSGEIKVVTKSGTVKELSITLYPVKSWGKLGGVHGIAKDNTALRRADKLVREQAITLDTTLESITEGFFSLDKNHCFSSINSFGAKIIGKEKEEILGKNILTLFPNLYATDFYTNYIEVYTSKAVCRFEDRFGTKDGFYSYNMYKREDGVAVFFMDITDQKKAQAELEKLSLVASKTSSAVIIVDDKKRIEWVNESFVKSSGYLPEEVIGKVPDNIFFGKETDKTVIKRLSESFLKNIPFSEEILQYNKNGEKIWVAIDGTPIFDEHGKLSKYISITNNISARKQDQEQLLLAKEQAEMAAQAKTQFLSVMSHEIRTPMNAVIGFTNLLMEQNPRPDQLDHLKILQFSAKNLLVLINDILDYNKIESGKIEFEEIDFDLQELINNVRASLLQKAEEKNIAFNLFLDRNLPKVTGDPVRIGQIFTNLISNAVKFTEEGMVNVSASIKNQDLNNATIDFEISDTGIGIANEKYDAIFESFTQGNSDTTRKFGGTGLGLTITKRILELLGSKIKLKSTEGKGSTFYFTLTFPVSKSKHTRKSLKTRSSYVKSHPKIKLLVAEDNEINILLIKLFLEQWHFEFDIAKNGLEAFELIQKNDYDIVLMDLQMPHMDGYETAAAIRALPDSKYSNLPIIALTASAMLDIKDKAFDAGMNDYISKPFNPEDLYNIILQYAMVKNEEELLKCSN